MPYLPLRSLPPRPSQALTFAWLERLADRLAGCTGDVAAERSVVCRETLAELAYPEYAANWETAVADESIPLGTRLSLAALDPRHVTLEPEYYSDCDDARFQPVKPLLWLWYSFDRLPIGGQNVELGVQLRRVLAPYIFKRVGANFKAFQHVEFTFGYNLEVGDNVVVHRHVLLDDRGGIRLGNKVSISDYANIYSHTHSIVEQADVTNALAVATKDVRPYHVYVGIPAKSVRVKPNAPEPATILRTAENRLSRPAPDR